MRYIVLVPSTPDTEAGGEPPEDLAGAVVKFQEDLQAAGVLVAGEGLLPTSEGARVRFDGTERVVSKGPFTDPGPEGYWILQCDSIDEAIGWVKRAPFDNGIEMEIRPMYEFN